MSALQKDLVKCKNETCELRGRCWRFVAPWSVSSGWQQWTPNPELQVCKGFISAQFAARKMAQDIMTQKATI